MGERNLDFDTVIDRNGTDSLKYDFATERGIPKNVLPLWVADMDFRVSSCIQDALSKQVEHGIYGYTETKRNGSYFAAVARWMKQHHDWEVKPQWLIKTPGVVFGLAMAIKAFTKPGEAVLLQQPVYYPFREAIEDNGRRLVNNPLRYADGTYTIDFEDFEDKLVKEKVKLFILCNPHNPVGRVWGKEELTRLGQICLRHGVIVFSDEIHSDFVYEDGCGNRMGHDGNVRHYVFANLDPAFSKITITGSAPTKTFNTAGLQIANLFVEEEGYRRRLRKEIAAAGYSQLSGPAIVACEAAYRNGGEWYRAVHAYIRDNIRFAEEYVKQKLPRVRFVKPQGTYLLWLDFRAYHLSEEALEERIVKKAGLWLDRGAVFGSEGEGFERINAACPRATLQSALKRLADAFSED